MLESIGRNSWFIRAKISACNLQARFAAKKMNVSRYVSGDSPRTDMLPILSSRGTQISIANRGIAHRIGLLHPTVHMLLFDDKGRILVQKRGFSKDSSAGKLSQSVGGHVPVGMIPEDALAKEAVEELGLEGLTFKFVSRYGYSSNEGRNNELVSLYVGKLTCGRVVINPTELAWASWFDFKGLLA